MTPPSALFDQFCNYSPAISIAPALLIFALSLIRKKSESKGFGLALFAYISLIPLPYV